VSNTKGLEQVQISRLITVAEEAADVAGAVIRPFFRARHNITANIQMKADMSPVTLADRIAEQAMRAVLAKHFPEHGILGEEHGLERSDARLRWVLDPIDGTRAFITGRPVFGTLIALLDAGTPIVGVIDQPITGERWVGVTGQPTRFSGPFGGRPECRGCENLANAELSCTSPQMLNEEETLQWRNLAGEVQRVSWGGDCYAYGLLALGQIDLIAEADMKPWDWPALLVVVEGAGGRVTDWKGRTLRADSCHQVLAVGDPKLLPHAVALLSKSNLK